MEKGTVVNRTEKGYCFVRSSKGDNIFVHINNVNREVYEKLATWKEVRFFLII